MTRLFATLVAGFLSLLGLVTPTAAAGVPSPASAICAYDSHHHESRATHITAERAPPATYDNATAYDPDGRRLLGDLARPNGTTSRGLDQYGITKNPATRYTPRELNGGSLNVLARGSKQDMLGLERSLHETLPIGPEEGQLFYVQKQIEAGFRPPPYPW